MDELPMKRSSLRLCFAGLGVALAACSSSSAPLTEYPTDRPEQNEGDAPAVVDSRDAGADREGGPDSGPVVVEPTFEAKLLFDGFATIEGATSDGHIVAFRNLDLVVLPVGA